MKSIDKKKNSKTPLIKKEVDENNIEEVASKMSD
jgi:hypothetical protein